VSVIRYFPLFQINKISKSQTMFRKQQKKKKQTNDLLTVKNASGCMNHIKITKIQVGPKSFLTKTHLFA
jgi:hypothetical protein